MAQEGESPSKTINKIKRDGSYVYAEATAKTREEAAEAAKQLLLIEISQYVATKKKFSGADQVLIKDMQTESQSIEMPRGDMTRVFLYVKKMTLLPPKLLRLSIRKRSMLSHRDLNPRR